MLYEDAMEPSHLLQQKEVRIYFDNTIVVEPVEGERQLLVFFVECCTQFSRLCISDWIEATQYYKVWIRGMCSSNKVYKCNS